MPELGNYGAIPQEKSKLKDDACEEAGEAPHTDQQEGFACSKLLRVVDSWHLSHWMLALVTFCITVLLLSFWLGSFGYLSLTISTNEQYIVYVMRHAEERKVKPYKCDPPQHPALPPTIGSCGTWGDNRCGGDYLTNAGMERAQCIAASVPLEGVSYLLAQYPGTCFDHKVVKREYQSLLPLAELHGLKVDATLHKGDNFLAAELLSGEKIRSQLCRRLGEVSVKTLKSGDAAGLIGGAGGLRTDSRGLSAAPTTAKAVHAGSRRSAVVSWDHKNIPILLRFLGCPADNELCTDRYRKREFDMFYKVTMACSDGSLLSVEKQHQGCNADAVGGGDDENDDESSFSGSDGEVEKHAQTPSVASTEAPTPYPVIDLDFNTSALPNEH